MPTELYVILVIFACFYREHFYIIKYANYTSNKTDYSKAFYVQ